MGQNAAGSKKLYVGNLPFSINEDELKAEFENQGFDVIEAIVILDRETKKPRGFGFVTIAESQLENALSCEMEVGGRKLKINEAIEKEKSNSRGSDDRGRRPSQYSNNRR